VRPEMRAGARECLLEAGLIVGLKKKVQCVDLERANSVAVVRGHEHDGRHAVRVDVLHNLEPIHTRHLDVEKHKIRLQAVDRFECRWAIIAGGDDFEIGLLLKSSSSTTMVRII